MIHDTKAQESSSMIGEAQEAASACIKAHCQEAAPADIEAQQFLRDLSNGQRLGGTGGHVIRHRGARVLIFINGQQGTSLRGRVSHIAAQESSSMIREAQEAAAGDIEAQESSSMIRDAQEGRVSKTRAQESLSRIRDAQDAASAISRCKGPHQ